MDTKIFVKPLKRKQIRWVFTGIPYTDIHDLETFSLFLASGRLIKKYSHHKEIACEMKFFLLISSLLRIKFFSRLHSVKHTCHPRKFLRILPDVELLAVLTVALTVVRELNFSSVRLQNHERRKKKVLIF